ncbi:MAG: glycosyltransferase [Candidatus Saccharimonas sp.]
MKKTLRVNLVSESEFTVQGHGVHTAYIEMRNALRKVPGVDVSTNAKGRGFDIVHVHTVGLYSLQKLLFSAPHRVVSAHVVPDSFIGSLRAAALWRPLAKLWLKFFYNRAHLVLAVSDYTKRELQELGVRSPIAVLYNTIDTTRYKVTPEKKKIARKKLGISEDAFVVIGSGQVQPRKRVDVYQKMATQLPDVTFIWVGGVPFGAIAADSHAMQHMMKHSLPNLQFTGVIPLDDVVTYYQAADVFVLPSEQETFGLVVVEAAAAGLPVVLRDIADYDDTFRGDVLMASGDESFAHIVEQLREDSQAYKKAQKGSQAIAKRYDSAAGAKTLLELYRGIIKG